VTASAAGAADAPIGTARKWTITGAVMLVTVMQVLDVTVTNVAFPHIQGSLSAGVDEVSWVLTSYLAANAVILPATGWLAAAVGRKRFFLGCTVVFTLASVLCGLAPNITVLLLARMLQGIGGGPLMPLSQAIMWEIFPLRQRGMAMAAWGMGIMMAPIFGPTLGGWIADNWSWRWIFYINVPIGVIGFLVASAVLFDPPYLRKPARVDVPGLVLMAVGFLSLQLFLDQGERHEWFDSWLVLGLATVAAVSLLGFLLRELTAAEPILDLSVYADRVA
jgi:MFS transporter, DHA2 family, multidrug resistance protein